MRGKFRIPRPGAAIIIAVIALVFALGGGAIAAKKLSLGALSGNAKNKTVGVGKLTYVNTTATFNTPSLQINNDTLTAQCPSGLRAIGGSAKTSRPSGQSNFALLQDYPTSTGWTATFFVNGPPSEEVTVTAICANSRAVTGAPPTQTP
jgi:hypothetical protein